MKNQTIENEIFNELNRLSLEILPCKEPIPLNLKNEYEEAYLLWHKVWSNTLFKLDGIENLHSNEFTRHDFCSVIYRDERAIGLFCYSQINPSLITRHSDSWFAAWPKEILFEIGKFHSNGIMPAWLAVDPEFRRSKTAYPINIGQILMETYAQIILEYGYEIGFGTTRNDRGVNKLILDTGGQKLGSSIDHGVSVDLICMHPERVQDKQSQFSEEFKYLWNNKKDHWRGIYEQQSILHPTYVKGRTSDLRTTLAN